MTIALVTGASSGIGKAIYEHLQDRYDRVIGVSKRGPDMELDLTQASSIQFIVGVLGNGGLDCLVNCAGILDLGEHESDDRRRLLFETNFWAPYNLTNRLYVPLRESHGCVINIASVSGMMADPDTPVYGASKAALLSLTKTLAVKWAPNIRVNAISPGFFDTMLVPEPTPPELIIPVPLGFEAECSMILPVVDALINSPYVTGSNYVCDGGLHVAKPGYPA